MRYDEFYRRVLNRYAEQQHMRLGQVFFNELVLIKPELAERLRGTELDTFYQTSLSRESVAFVFENW